MDKTPLPWVIVGAGRVGQLLGLLGQRYGYDVVKIWNRSESSGQRAAKILGLNPQQSVARIEDLKGALASPCVVWFTLVDTAITPVAEQLAAWIHPHSKVLHTAGSLPSSILKDAGIVAPCGSLHPLQSIANPTEALAQTHLCTWTVEGDAEVVSFATTLMKRHDITPVHILPSAKALYHASAVTAAGLVVSLMDAAFEMAKLAGVDAQQVQRDMLLPLARSCLNNLATMTPGDALTGPVARGDEKTIQRHLDALKDHEDLLEIYAALTKRARVLK